MNTTILLANIIISAILAAQVMVVYKKISVNIKIAKLRSNSIEITPSEFFKIRNTKKIFNNRKNISTDQDFEGIYILYNQTKQMYYIGQSKNVIKRVNTHFTGKGNGDVYADYKYGDDFVINMLSLSKSGYTSLNALERDAIDTYQAYSKGYNKTKGNKDKQ